MSDKLTKFAKKAKQALWRVTLANPQLLLQNHGKKPNPLAFSMLIKKTVAVSAKKVRATRQKLKRKRDTSFKIATGIGFKLLFLLARARRICKKRRYERLRNQMNEYCLENNIATEAADENTSKSAQGNLSVQSIFE
jgi:hypothetical protein